MYKFHPSFFEGLKSAGQLKGRVKDRFPKIKKADLDAIVESSEFAKEPKVLPIADDPGISTEPSEELD